MGRYKTIQQIKDEVAAKRAGAGAPNGRETMSDAMTDEEIAARFDSDLVDRSDIRFHPESELSAEDLAAAQAEAFEAERQWQEQRLKHSTAEYNLKQQLAQESLDNQRLKQDLAVAQAEAASYKQMLEVEQRRYDELAEKLMLPTSPVVSCTPAPQEEFLYSNSGYEFFLTDDNETLDIRQDGTSLFQTEAFQVYAALAPIFAVEDECECADPFYCSC